MIYEICAFYPYTNTLRVESEKPTLREAKKEATRISRLKLYGSPFVQVWKKYVSYEDGGLVHEIN